MNDKKNLSRRRFLQSTGSMGSAAYLRLLGSGFIAITEAACTAKQEASPFKILGAEEASDFAAIAARIIPTTNTPGATEAGVIHFFDNAFAAEMSSQLDVARTGLAAFNAALEDAHPDRGRFGDLGEDDQDAFLRSQESGEFFSLAWTMTVFGFFSMEKYGGNEGHIGWELIGFDGHHGAWQYPFGYYDAEVHGETNHGE
jgi:gluconate 2-dehydrogenase gamma chain